MNFNHIYLIGMMGSGKSTIGQLLASAVNYNFIDTDSLIEENTGLKIYDIFKIFGETYFRNLENQTLRDSTENQKQKVIACGGGLPLIPGVMEYMKENGLVLFLKGDPAISYSRIYNKNNRPLLKNKKDFEDLFNERLNTYKRAHFSVNADDNPQKIIENILLILQDFGS